MFLAYPVVTLLCISVFNLRQTTTSPSMQDCVEHGGHEGQSYLSASDSWAQAMC